MSNTAHATADDATPEHVAERELGADCCICQRPVDLHKPCAWWKDGRRVAHLHCYDGAWFTAGIADRIGAEAQS